MVGMLKNVAIVSLSRGIIGESFVKHELDIGVQRLKDFGLNVRFMPHALKGLEYVEHHPEKRVEDLLAAFSDPEIDMILCAIGGDDTFRLLPYLFDNDELKKAAKQKVFLGFSDTTINHFMLHKVGIKTFYGQSFLADICEIDKDMLPYTKKYFEELISTSKIQEITPSDLWYENRKDFSVEQVGTPLISHPNKGFKLLQGKPQFSGEILGGCIDSMYDLFNGDRYKNMPLLAEKYGIFPAKEGWKNKIILLESSEELMPPEQYRKALSYLKSAGVFDMVNGVLVGKPMDETYAAEYEAALIEVIDNPELPILTNLSIGHALPRCIIPFGVEAHVDAKTQRIRFVY